MFFNDFDFSTIHVDRLKKYPVYKVPRTYRLQDAPGNACAGDAPGYPTYFTRVVWTQYGNYGRGNHLIICDPDNVPHIVGKYGDESTTHRLRQLWIPVSQDSVRFALWELHTYRFYRHCYYDPGRMNKYEGHILIAPTKPKQTHTDRHGNEHTNYRYEDELLEYNRIIAEKRHLLTNDNHFAVHYIRKFYPGYLPDIRLIEAASDIYDIIHDGEKIHDEVNNRWWERFASPSTVVDYTGMPVERNSYAATTE